MIGWLLTGLVYWLISEKLSNPRDRWARVFCLVVGAVCIVMYGVLE